MLKKNLTFLAQTHTDTLKQTGIFRYIFPLVDVFWLG